MPGVLESEATLAARFANGQTPPQQAFWNLLRTMFGTAETSSAAAAAAVAAVNALVDRTPRVNARYKKVAGVWVLQNGGGVDTVVEFQVTAGVTTKYIDVTPLVPYAVNDVFYKVDVYQANNNTAATKANGTNGRIRIGDYPAGGIANGTVFHIVVF
ncbi:MAG: hypothetical protein JWM68_225 [Verrucomicrobiales bacterium]|nr:hypothetical protein [Verrucomicrobiales bacterium]